MDSKKAFMKRSIFEESAIKEYSIEGWKKQKLRISGKNKVIKKLNLYFFNV